MAPAPSPRKASRRVWPFVLCGLLLILPLPGWIAAVFVSAPREFREAPMDTREFAFVRRHLQAPFHAYGTLDVLAPQFGVVALSHMAAGMMNAAIAQPERRAELAPLTAEIVRRARSSAIAPRHRETRGDAPIDDHNLYWSHLALVLGVDRFIRCGGSPCAADTESDRLQERIVSTLRERLLASDTAQAPSYPGSATWPADNTVTLVAIRLYDATHGTHRVDEPLRGFLRVMNAHRDRATGLFHSCMSPLWYHAIPRGCAISWSTIYLAQLSPEVAHDQYARARRCLSRDILGMGGFREWPEGRGGRMDGDSGPIVWGVGMAATGLGLGAARLFGDVDRYVTIRRTALVFGGPSWIPSHGYVLSPVLGEAILFDGRTARPWFSPLRAVGGDAPWPWIPALLVLLDLWLIARIARRVRGVVSG